MSRAAGHPVEPVDPPRGLTPTEADGADWDIVIGPTRGWMPLDLREYWSHRDLLYFLVWRSVKVRYKQTALGAAWAVIPAVMTMVVFTLIFGRLAHIASDGAPYQVFSYAGLVPWTFFSGAVGFASTSLVDNERLVTRVYFPRLLIPLSAVLGGTIDFAISFVLLILLGLGFGVVPEVKILAALPLGLLVTVAAFAVGSTLAALNVFYRDVRYVIGFLMQFWLFATPVAYPSGSIPDRWLPLYALNPMVGPIDAFRWAVLPDAPGPWLALGVSSAVIAAVVVGGVYYFRRVEDSFADVV